MKSKIVRGLVSVGLFVLMAVSPQILGMNSQTVNAMPGKGGSNESTGKDSSGKKEEKVVKIAKNKNRKRTEGTTCLVADECIGKNGEVIIEDGATAVYVGGFKKNQKVKSIAFPNSVKKIVFGNACFDRSSIETVMLPQSLEEITFEDGSFWSAPNISSIVFPDNVNKISFGQAAFEGSGIKTVTFPKNLVDLQIGIACFNLTKKFEALDLSKTKVENLDFAKSCFGASSVSKVVLPLNIKKAKFGDSSFAATKNLSKPIIFFMVDSVEFEVNSFFESGIPEIRFAVPKSAKNISFGCSSFYNSSISKLTFPQNLEEVNFGEHSFQKTSTLKNEINLNNAKNVIFGQASFGESYVPAIKFIGSSRKISFGVTSFSKSKISSLDFPEHLDEVEFKKLSFTASDIKKIVIPAGAKIGAIEKGAFFETKNLDVFDLSNIKLTEFSKAFTFHNSAFHSSNIRALVLPNVKNISFEEECLCNTHMPFLEVPKCTKNVVFGQNCLRESRLLKGVNFLSDDEYTEDNGIPKGTRITFKEGSFLDCEGEISFPKDLYSLTIEKDAFSLKELKHGMKKFDLSETAIRELNIPEKAFFLSTVEEVRLPGCIKILTIGPNAFGNSKIKGFKFVDGGKSLQKLSMGAGAFVGTLDFDGFNLKDFTGLVKFSCAPLAFFESKAENLILPPSLIATLQENAFSGSNIANLDLSEVKKLHVSADVLKDSKIQSLKLPYTTNIEYKNRTPGSSDVDFLGCSSDVKISRNSDFVLDVPNLDFLDETEEEEEYEEDNEDNINNVLGFNLKKDNLMNILAKKYPLFANYVGSRTDSNEDAAKRRAIQNVYHTTFREISRERADLIANTVILLDENGYPAEGNIAEDTNCQPYQERNNDILGKKGLEFYPTISKINGNGSYTTTAPSAYNDRIIVTNNGVFLKQHHQYLPEAVICLFGKGKYQKYIGKARVHISIENRYQRHWVGEFKG